MGHIIMRTKIYLKTIPIMSDKYVRKEVSKKGTSQVTEKFDEFVGDYKKPHEHKKLKKFERIGDNR